MASNGYYNNPMFAQAAQNIASMFAPPSAQDSLYAAKAAETKQKMQALGEFFKYGTNPENMKDPNYNRTLDAVGIGVGNYTPNQSFYSVDQGNKTTLEGKRIDAGSALAVARQNGQNDLTKLFATPIPVNKDQTVFLPEAAQKGMGLQPTLRGNVGVGQGDRTYLPDAQGNVGPNSPMLQGQAKPPAGSDILNYQTPDGKSGTTIYDPVQGKLVDTQTGASLPAGTRTYKASVEGGADATGLGATTANQTEANRLAASIDATDQLINQYEAILKQNPGVAGAPGNIRGIFQDIGSVVGELSAAFGAMAPDTKLTLEQVQGLAQRVGGNRDPNIQVARNLAASLAYQDAQLQNPSGEVSRQAFERSLEKLTGGMLANNQSALEGIQGMRMMIDAKRKQVQSLRGPSQVAPMGAQPPAPAAVERWERDPATGLPRRVQ